MTWSQNYDPLHAWPLSTLVSALAGDLALRGAGRAEDAGLGGGAVGAARWPSCWRSSSFACRPTWSPASAAHGVVFGLIRIAWIIVASIFLYQIAVETGQFQVMKESIAALSTRQADAAHPGRLLLRGLSRGDRRRRSAGGDRRVVPDRARASSRFRRRRSACSPTRRPSPGGQSARRSACCRA